MPTPVRSARSPGRNRNRTLPDNRSTRVRRGSAYVDGEFCPIEEARIPLLDWGFLRSTPARKPSRRGTAPSSASRITWSASSARSRGCG